MGRLKSPFWEALGVFGGMIIGSGMFALPYAVFVSGLWASLIGGALALFAVLSIHLAYGEVVLYTAERHRLPGYVKLYLGNFAGNFNKIGQVIFFNAALLIYGVLGGIFLTTIFGASSFWWTIAFFLVSATILFFESVENIGFINFLLTIPLILVTILIAIFAFNKGLAANIPLYGSDPFFAFGIFVFSLTGLATISDAREILRDGEVQKPMKSVIALGTVVPMILYAIFIGGVLSAAGGSVSEDAISSLELVLGRPAVVAGAVVGFLAVFTSFLALAYDLKRIYELDMKMRGGVSWAVSAVLPALLFLFGLENFVKLISISGGIFIAIDGFFVIFILRRMRQTGLAALRFLPFGLIHQAALILIFSASIVYEVVYQIL